MLRRISWVLFSAAVLIPTAYAWFQLTELYKMQPALTCGLPFLAIISVSFLAAILLSTIATGFAWIAFYRLPKPRPTKRKLELVLVTLPAMLGVLFIALIFS